MELVTLTLVDRERLLEWLNDFRSAGETRFDFMLQKVQTDYPAYVAERRRFERGEGLAEGFSPATDYFLERDGQVFVGSLSLRHVLVPRLQVEGGHIGYAVRPSERRKGYATRMLALALEKARQLGLERVLVTCDTDNVPSARVIEKNGGVLENYARSPYTGKQISRYWIQLI